MNLSLRVTAFTICLLGILSTCALLADEVAPANREAAPQPALRLLNTKVFGKSADEPIVVLRKAAKGAIAPESVFLDIDDSGTYYASTVRYPLQLGLEGVRKLLNKEYGEWEKKDFAKDPTMGLWRNEDDKFSIQLTEDNDNVVVIYISFARVPADRLERAFERVADELSKESEE